MIGYSGNNRGQLTGDGPEPGSKHKFNPAAKPFMCQWKRCAVSSGGTGNQKKAEAPREQDIAYIGPTHLPVNTRIWSSISSYSLEDIARTYPPVARAAQSQQLAKVFPVVTNGFSNAYPVNKTHHASCPANQAPFGPILLSNGVIQLSLRDSILVELTLNSVKVINPKKNIAISVSVDTTAAAMHHPNGVVFQNGAQVEIVACDAKKSNNFIRFAKMWQKGISFTSQGCAVIYLVDSAGTRTTSDLIGMDLRSNYVDQVFFSDVTSDAETMDALEQVVRRSNYHLGSEGSLVYQINNCRITQGSDGLVKLSCQNNQYSIRTSPSNGSATVTTPGIHCTASLGATSHLFVRREERRMHFDGAVFIVRNAGHSAGFDELNRLRVY
uniref:Uncharacterized protein n=1 Tax=Anopheles atroparvus TaxID=41427 RepID=A0A182IVX5_ANOAO